jgi:hypothetical protein
VSGALRPGLLEDVAVLVAGDPGTADTCAALGAAVAVLAADLADEDAVGAAVGAQALPATLVCATGDVDRAFIATRAVATRWIAEERGGKVVLVAPADDGPTRAALENLARTLSVEWARFGITPTAILPGEGADDAVAELVAFLASPAGDYYSGCAFTLSPPALG